MCVSVHMFSFTNKFPLQKSPCPIFAIFENNSHFFLKRVYSCVFALGVYCGGDLISSYYNNHLKSSWKSQGASVKGSPRAKQYDIFVYDLSLGSWHWSESHITSKNIVKRHMIEFSRLRSAELGIWGLVYSSFFPGAKRPPLGSCSHKFGVVHGVVWGFTAFHRLRQENSFSESWIPRGLAECTHLLIICKDMIGKKKNVIAWKIWKIKQK